MPGQATNEGHSSHPILEDLVIHGDKQRAHVLGLSEMLIEAFMQRRQYGLSDTGVCLEVSTAMLQMHHAFTYQDLQWRR